MDFCQSNPLIRSAGLRKLEEEVSFTGVAKGPLASEAATWKLTVPLNNEKLPVYSSASAIVRVPPKTKRMRFAVRDLADGRMGTVDLNPSVVATAPEIDTPAPALQPRKPAQ